MSGDCRGAENDFTPSTPKHVLINTFIDFLHICAVEM